MITLKADNRQLSQNAKISYLSNNYLSAVSSVVLTNSLGFSANDYVLFGNFGSETSEIVKVSTVTAATHTLSLVTATKFAHSESTKITILKYNQVRYYHTATATFSASSPLGTIDIQADDYATKYYDSSNTTGFGWFVFLNETTSAATQNSNAIPYAGFSENSVKTIIDNFFSLLNSKDSKIISTSEAFSWLNEGYAIAQNELNLVNNSYTVPASQNITTIAATQEYAWADYMSKIISVYNTSSDTPINKIDISEVDANNDESSNTVRYYTRSGYMGFSPIPTEAVTYTVKYKANATTLTSYYETVTLPDKAYNIVKDFMMFRASEKLNKANPTMYLDLFNEGLKRMKVTSHKQDSSLDAWDIANEANV